MLYQLQAGQAAGNSSKTAGAPAGDCDHLHIEIVQHMKAHKSSRKKTFGERILQFPSHGITQVMQLEDGGVKEIKQEIQSIKAIVIGRWGSRRTMLRTISISQP